MAQRMERLITGSDTLRMLARFLIVGMAGTLLDFTLFTLLHIQFGLTGLLANTFSYSAGIVNNYLIHRRWTFATRPQKAAGRQFAQFAAISLSALVANTLVVLLLAPAFRPFFADQVHASLLAKVCATGVGVAWNFLANHRWTFGEVVQLDRPASIAISLRALRARREGE